MSRLIALGVLCLALSGCVYYPYGYAPPRYRYAPGYAPPGYAPPASSYPYAPYGAPQPYPYGSAYPQSSYPQSLGPTGDTAGAVGGN